MLRKNKNITKGESCLISGGYKSVRVAFGDSSRRLKNGEQIFVDDLIELAYRYLREIEHSDENLEKVEVLDWLDCAAIKIELQTSEYMGKAVERL